jgi:surfactin synthase thioesterase subunit
MALVDAQTQIVIGHSLGSVVAYEAMHRLTHALPLLLTIGSPLGLETIIYQHLRPQPPEFPSVVQRWVNVTDRNDLVAAEPNLLRMFATGLPSGARFESGYTVDNGAEPHRADFYLTKAQVGKPIGETLRTS